MGDGTEQNPYTREDVLRLIRENGGKAEGLDLSGKWFEQGIDLCKLNLEGIILKKAVLVLAHLEEAYLRDAHLEEAILGYAHLEGADLCDAHLEGASLVRAHLQEAVLGDAHLGRADLGGAYLEGAYLYGVRFPADTKLEDVDWGNYILGEEKGNSIGLAAFAYRRLKVWYSQAGYHYIAAKFYYREKEASRKSLRWRSKSSFRHRLALNLSYLVFGHGEGWKRLLFWMAGVILGLSLVYFFFRGVSPYTFNVQAFLNSLYYSAVSFTALGYGNWAPEPTGWAKAVGVAEAFIGVFTIALFLVTFTRKMTR